MPELGTGPEVVADIRAEEGPTAPIRYADVVVTHPIHWERDHWVGAAQGAAARESERVKWRRYAACPDGNPVLLVPLAFETYGRWGDAASAELRRLARLRSALADSRQSVDPNGFFRGCLIRWRRQVSVVLQQGNAAMLCACTAVARAGVHAAPASDSSVADLITD